MVWLAVLASFILTCCKKTEETNENNAYSEQTQYNDVAWGLSTFITNVYNQHIAGQHGGNWDITVPGPGGGTIRITGTVSSNQQEITTADLNYDFLNCVAVISSGNGLVVTFHSLSGIINENGSWRSVTVLHSGYKSVTLSSGNVAISAKLEREVSADFNNSGNFYLTSTSNTAYPGAETNSTNGGELCGHQVAW
jgi:hypothetical protein